MVVQIVFHSPNVLFDTLQLGSNLEQQEFSSYEVRMLVTMIDACI